MSDYFKTKEGQKTFTKEEMLQSQMEAYNELEGVAREDYQCDLCKNKEVVYVMNKDKTDFEAKNCGCKKIRNTLRDLRISGIDKAILQRYTFENFTTDQQYQKAIKNRAIEYWKEVVKESNENNWFIITGQTGCGKSHICTALFQNLVMKKSYKGEYFLWTRDCVKYQKMSKSFDDTQFKAWEKRLQECDVLYIDDFLKKTENENAYNMAYQIINERYNSKKITIISSEYSYGDIANIDEAIAGRLNEMTQHQKNWIFISKDESKNFRNGGN